MDFYLEASYNFPIFNDSNPGYIFDSQFTPFPAGDCFQDLNHQCSFQSFQPSTSLINNNLTTTLNTEYTPNDTSASQSPTDLSPITSELFDSASSPSSGTASPRSPPKGSEPETSGPADLHQIGYLDVAGNWRCQYPGCCSSRAFLRICDLRKHFRGHAKYFFCTEERCQQAGVGFATRKDFQRHMGSHTPAVRCLHPDCDRIFSRKDNMVCQHKQSEFLRSTTTDNFHRGNTTKRFTSAWKIRPPLGDPRRCRQGEPAAQKGANSRLVRRSQAESPSLKVIE